MNGKQRGESNMNGINESMKCPTTLAPDRQSDVAFSRLSQISDRVGKMNEALRMHASPLLRPEEPICQPEPAPVNNAESEFFTELLVGINVLSSRLDDLETTISRIEV